MERLIRKYVDKLGRSGLAEAGVPLMGARDAELIWNRDDKNQAILEEIFAGLHISTLLFAPPAEPYRTLVDFLARTSPGTIHPQDTETRTFLHNLPVVTSLAPAEIIRALKNRKCASSRPGDYHLWNGKPEQAFVTFSSDLLCLFRHCFSPITSGCPERLCKPGAEGCFQQVVDYLGSPARLDFSLTHGPFRDEATVLTAMEEAGKATVDCRLVDSYFGNISCLFSDILHISQTGSSLDELRGCIDPVPMDGSSCVGITASSELSAHRAIVAAGTHRTVLHGHPKFSVILSLACNEKNACCGDNVISAAPSAAGGRRPHRPRRGGNGPFGLAIPFPRRWPKHGVPSFTAMVSSPSGNDFNDAFASSLTSKTPAGRVLHQPLTCVFTHRRNRHHFLSSGLQQAEQIRVIPGPDMVFNEAHRLRNVYKNSNKIICEAEQHLCLAGGESGVFRIDSSRTPWLKSLGDLVCIPSRATDIKKGGM
jgi:hypothetical protein